MAVVFIIMHFHSLIYFISFMTNRLLKMKDYLLNWLSYSKFTLQIRHDQKLFLSLSIHYHTTTTTSYSGEEEKGTWLRLLTLNNLYLCSYIYQINVMVRRYKIAEKRKYSSKLPEYILSLAALNFNTKDYIFCYKWISVSNIGFESPWYRCWSWKSHISQSTLIINRHIHSTVSSKIRHHILHRSVETLR